ncbi:MAG: TolC family protein [Cytophagales bacterium]|nr:TolC family protein [Cytophagales bacterium]
MIRLIKIGLLLLGCCSWGLAQEVKQLHTVEDALELAASKNPDLEVFKLQVKQSRVDMQAAKKHRLPTVNASFSGQNNRSLATTPLPGEIFGQPGEVVNAQFGQPYNYNAGITVSKSVLDMGNRVEAKVATAAHDLQQLEQGAYEQKLTYQTAYYYYLLLITNKATQLNQQDTALMDSILAISRQKREKGLINQTSFLQAKILANTARENLSSSHARQQEYALQLKLLLGQSDHVQLQLEEELDVQSINQVSAEMGQDQELMTTKAEVELADLRVRQSKTAFLPKLTLESYFGQQQFREEFGLSMRADDWSAYSYLGISLQVPLFTGFKNKNNLKSAQLAAQIATKRFENQEQTTAFQDKMLLQNFIASKDRVVFAEENFELYQESVGLSLQQFEQGLIGLDEHLSKVEDLLKAEQHYLNALTTFYSYYATIRSRKS